MEKDSSDFVKKEKEKRAKKEKELDKKSTKRMVITLLSLIAIIAVLLLANVVFKFIKEDVLGDDEYVDPADELHKDNLEGKESEGNFMYNGFSFVFDDNLWKTVIMRQESNKAYDIPLHYNPKQLEDIVVEKGVNQFMDAANIFKKVYITFDPAEHGLQYVTVSTSELVINFYQVLGIDSNIACTRNETEGCDTVPTITCDTAEDPVIYLKREGPSSITVDGPCIVVQGEGEEIIRSAERLIYAWYGIMPI